MQSTQKGGAQPLLSKSKLTLCRISSLYTLRVNMELADKMEESADDMTAADTAPNPMKATTGGVRYCITRGKIRDGYSSGSVGSSIFVRFQSEKKKKKQKQ